jgi:hypothetical protein
MGEMEATPDTWILLQPPFAEPVRSAGIFVEHAATLASIQRTKGTDAGDASLAEALETTLLQEASWPPQDRALLTAGLRVITDLARQRWKIRTDSGDVEVCPLAELGTDPQNEKERVRRQELLKRDEQLAQPAVRKFVQAMERLRLHGQRFVSIFSLMRDGRKLAEALRSVRGLPAEERLPGLQEIVDPYLQFVSDEARCQFTGLRLLDIWRYFRHLWTNPYMSTPGRTTMFLVRDRAAPLHPIIGIGAIGSPIVQIQDRDTWIGWHPTVFLERAREFPVDTFAAWLRRIIERAIAELYLDDLIEDEVMPLSALRCPTPDVVMRLMAFGMEQRRLHYRFARSRDHKDHPQVFAHNGSGMPWIDKARTHLFRSKRAFALADLLRARIALERHLGDPPTPQHVARLLADPEGKHAVTKILRKAKADHVGISMADITVCGAVPPYNAILGGKLVAMLAVGPEVVQMYRERYGHTESEIASSMAGRPIVRPADLVFFGTTSLYGVGSSQYNRIRIPAERLGGHRLEALRYAKLGRSRAFGTSHYRNETVMALVDLVQQSNSGQRVNSIFGEGVNPKLRKVRQGLNMLYFPDDKLLQHGRRRIVYGISLIRNLCAYLLGIEDDPDYIFTIWGAEATEIIVSWWRERWLARRICSDSVLEEVAQHTCIQPIRHGARVRLPAEPSEQMALFDDLC